jgi:hypothetical protein
MKVQEDVDRWSQETQNLVNELLDLQTRLEWTSYQNQKHLSYIQQEKETIDDLRRKKRELKSLWMKSEPFLSQVIFHPGYSKACLDNHQDKRPQWGRWYMEPYLVCTEREFLNGRSLVPKQFQRQNEDLP